MYVFITRLAPNEIFSPSNKIQREVGRAKDLSAPLFITSTIYDRKNFIYRLSPLSCPWVR